MTAHATGSMVMQTLIFEKSHYDQTAAVSWAEKHGKSHEKVDEKEDTFRLRQRDPADFEEESFRTIEIAPGVKSVVGHLKAAEVANHSFSDIVTIDVAGEMLEEFSEADYSEFKGDEDNEPWIERPAVLFEVGTHSGVKYDSDDLKAICETFSRPAGNRWTVPIQRTTPEGKHSSAADDTAGGVQDVWTDGNRLFGRLRFIGREAVRKVKSGLWQKLSPGIILAKRKRLREVTVTPFPRVAPAAIFSEETGGSPPMNKAGYKLGHSHGAAGKPKMSADELKTHAEKGGEGFAEAYNEGHDEGASDRKGTHNEPDGDEKTVGKESAGEEKGKKPLKAEHSEDAGAGEPDEIARLRAEFSEQTKRDQERIAALEEKNKKAEQVAHFSECTDLVDNFSHDGKTLPPMRQPELDLIVTFSDEQMELYKKYKESQPKVVEFSRYSTATAIVPPEVADAADAARAKAIIERYKPGWAAPTV